MRELAAIVLVLTLVCQNANKSRPIPVQGWDYCRPLKVPLEISSGLGLEVASHYFYMRPGLRSAASFGELTIRNMTGQTIESLLLVVGYFDQEDKLVFSIVYFGAIKGLTNTLENVRPFYETRLNHPVPPQGTLFLSGTNLLATAKIPRKARATYVFIRTRDEVHSHSSGPWGSDPILQELPPWFEISTQSTGWGKELLLRALVNEEGLIAQVTKIGSETPDDQFFELVRNQISRWRFFPAIRNGFATKEQLHIRLRFLPESPIPIRECSFEEGLPQTFAPVDVVPAEGRNDRWAVYYGGIPASGKFHGGVMYTTSPGKRSAGKSKNGTGNK